MNQPNISPPQKPLLDNGTSDNRRRVRCRDLYLPRGKGKTTRLLALADICGAPMICATNSQRNHILSECKKWGFHIPAVYTAYDLIRGNIIGAPGRDYIVDDADMVLRELIAGLSGGKAHVLAASATYNAGGDEFV